MFPLVLHFAIGIPAAIVAANGVEWLFHRYVLHGLGKRRSSFWSFHWHEHHALSRKNGMLDEHYQAPLSKWNGQTKELLALTLGALANIPLLWVVPGFAVGSVYTSFNYYRKHRRAHLDPEWARRNLPWHVDHHMGPNQDSNWCVTRPWFDNLLRTRIPYLGTEREKADEARRELKKQALSA